MVGTPPGQVPVLKYSGAKNTYALGLSGDGKVVVGRAEKEVGGDVWGAGIRWDVTTSPVTQTQITNFSKPCGSANAVSANGQVVVGVFYNSSPSANRLEAFRWLGSGDPTPMGVLSSYDDSSEALDVSSDGKVVVGYSKAPSGAEAAFIWDSLNGMRDLQSVLAFHGLSDQDGHSVTLWVLTQATGISDDGTVIVGVGKHPNGSDLGWMARIPKP